MTLAVHDARILVVDDEPVQRAAAHGCVLPKDAGYQKSAR